MCGIVGVFNGRNEPVSRDIVSRMTEMLTHRGPDGDGIYQDGPLGLGHRRLSIIDLTPAAAQPMESTDGCYVLTYNGEIYNFRELRAELEAKGHRFRSRSDTEVLLNGFMEWGLGVLDRLNGIFAFAVWDRKTRTLTLARDRYGVKPLYYTLSRGNFLFASEIKAFLAYPEFHARIDSEGLLEYFTFQNFFTDRTLFAGIRLLPAGSWLQVTLPLEVLPEPVTYWDYHFEEPSSPRQESEYLEELDGLLCKAVKRQLVSDVPVNAYLSGGMDSGTITAISSKELSKLMTFTIGFDMRSASGIEIGYDERERAKYMSHLFNTEHYEMVLKAGDMERALPKLVWSLEEPRVGQSYPNFYAAQLAGKLGKVVLSGAGGDEMFGGYPWRYYQTIVNDDFEHYIDKYYAYWQRLLPNSEIQKVFAPIWDDVSHVCTRDIFRNVFASHADTLTRPEDYLHHSLYFEAKTFLHGLLVIEDKLSMAHGLEARVPLLDNDLVDFAMRLPARLKLARLSEVVQLNENEFGDKNASYFEKTQDGKLLLRKAMQRYIPKSVTEGIKQGFSGPDASWFKGESIDYVREKLYSKNALLYDYLDRDIVHSLIESHLSGKENRRLLIWSLLNFEEWLAIFMKNGWRNLTTAQVA